MSHLLQSNFFWRGCCQLFWLAYKLRDTFFIIEAPHGTTLQLELCQCFHYKPLFSRVYNFTVKICSRLQLGLEVPRVGGNIFQQLEQKSAVCCFWLHDFLHFCMASFKTPSVQHFVQIFWAVSRLSQLIPLLVHYRIDTT